MKILLVGANGQLGRALHSRLKLQNSVVGTSRVSHSPADGIWKHADFARPGELRELIRSVCPHVIVNAAAYTAVDCAESNSDAAELANIHGPRLLAEEASRLEVPIVHFSTDYVFNGQGFTPWRESDTTEPLSVYGTTKLAGEEAIKSVGAKCFIIRTSWLYSGNGPSFVTKILQLAAQRPEISVVEDQVGALTSTRFVAETTSLLAVKIATNPGWYPDDGGLLHVACSGEASWYEVAREIITQARGLGLSIASPVVRPILSRDYSCAAVRPLNSRLDTAKLNKCLGIIPPDWRHELQKHMPKILESFFPSPIT